MEQLQAWLEAKGWFILEAAAVGDKPGEITLVAISPIGLKWTFTGNQYGVTWSKSDLDVDLTSVPIIETARI